MANYKEQSDSREDQREQTSSREQQPSRRKRGKSRKSKFDKQTGSGSESQTTSNSAGSGSTPGSLNDISWYSRYPSLLQAAASIPFPNRPGMTVNLGTVGGQGLAQEIPGVLSLHWAPSFGRSLTNDSPASLVGREVYARVRRSFSGSLEADAPDYVIYFGALDSFFSYIAALKRVYRILDSYTPLNYQLPDTLLGAMGFNPATVSALKADKMQLWSCINQLALMSGNFACPESIDYFKRHYWMNDNVYADSDSMASQFYVFVQDYFFKYSDKVANAAGTPLPGLTTVPAPWIRRADGTQYTIPNVVTALFNFGLSLYQALVAWDDAYTISGYLKRAYEGDAFFLVAEEPVASAFMPIYAPEVLTQIENSATLISYRLPSGTGATPTSYYYCEVAQDPETNAINTVPYYAVYTSPETAATMGYSENPKLSLRTLTPSLEEVTIASRLIAYSEFTLQGATTPMVPATPPSGMAFCLIKAGTEIPLFWSLSGTNYHEVDANAATQTALHSLGITLPSPFIWGIDLGSVQVSPTRTIAAAMFTVSQFDWHPQFVVLIPAIGGTASAPVFNNFLAVVNGDVHNLTVITRAQLDEINKVCLYSELNAFSLV